jgi:hypothetical protein
LAVSGLVSGVALDWPSSTDGIPHLQALLVLSAATVALFATGILLARRSRIGGLLGLGLTLYPFAFAIWDRRRVPLLEVGIAAVTVVAVLLIWRELEWPHSSQSA